VTETVIGWCNTWAQAGFAFPAPRLLDDARVSPALQGRVIEIRSAVDVTLRYDANAPHECTMVEGSRLRQGGFDGLVTSFSAESRRRADVPVVQVALNLVFVTDADCALTLMPAFLADGPRDWPGPLVAGRFPLRSWPRPLNLAIEWEDTARDWVLRRGEPVAYVLVETPDPDAVLHLVEAAATPALQRHRKGIDAVASLSRNVQPMFLRAERHRPATLLTPKELS